MRLSICILLLAIVVLGPLPPLLPSRPGPATRAGMQARCSVTISPSAWPSRCPKTSTWRMR